MKKVFQFLFILLFSIGISAQKKTKKKQKSEIIQEAAIVDSAYATEVGYPSDNDDPDVDTLNVKAGKAHVFLIKADQWNSQSFGDDQEEKELIKNFPKNTFEITHINTYTYIHFENGQFLDASENGNSYEAIAFWSGNKNDKIKTQEGIIKTTEFVAQQMGVKKESSYVINDKKYRKEVSALQSKNNFTPKSKEVMDFYLRMLSLPIISFLGDKELFLNQNQEKVKTIKTYFVEKNGKRRIYESIHLNEKNQPISVIHYGSEGNEKSNMRFEYENGILKQIKSKEENITAINYDDGQLILSNNIGEGDETKVYHLESGKILQKSYMIMQDENYAQMNTYSEETIKNNCVNYTINNELWTTVCSSKTDEFPYTSYYTSYQDGKILQTMNNKITKKSPILYQKFSSEDADGNSTKELKPSGTYQFNERNLLTSFDFTKNKESKRIEIDYAFYP